MAAKHPRRPARTTALSEASRRRRRGLAGALLAAGGLWLASPVARAAGGAYPQQPITIVVPFAAGGSLDTTARIIGDHLKQLLGQPVLIANRPGAGSAIGARSVATSAPDGYTLFLASGSAFGFLHLLLKDQNFQLSDFSPIAGLAVNTSLFVVRPSVPAKTLPELIALSRSTPGGLSFCTTGVNGLNHLQLEMFKGLVKASGTTFEVAHVPYNGVAPALTALRGSDNIQACTLPYSALVKNMHGKDVRVIAVQRGKRLAALPDVPTTGEQGFAAMDDNDQLVTLSAPKGTPAAVVQSLEAALKTTMTDPGVLRKLEEADVQPTFVGTQDAQKWLEKDVRKFSALIREARLGSGQ